MKRQGDETPSGSEISDTEMNASDTLSDSKEDVDVDFDFFDPRPADYHTIRTFMGHLFGPDAQDLPCGAMADAVVGQPLVGTTVKSPAGETSGDIAMDDAADSAAADGGSESPPFMLLTVLNMTQPMADGWAQELQTYLAAKSVHVPAAHTILTTPTAPNKDIGWVVSERIINAPADLAAPAYHMLVNEEVPWARDDSEPYNFAWWMWVCKVYTEVASRLGESDADESEAEDIKGRGKKPKKANLGPKSKRRRDDPSVVYYHQQEEELIEQFADVKFDFKFTRPDPSVTDARRVFQQAGIEGFRRVLFVREERMKDVVETLKNAFGNE